MTRADLTKSPFDVAEMFNGVAKRYDITNTILSFGQDRTWRSAATEALNLAKGEKVLDIAAGTGVSTKILANAGAHAVASDFSLGMMEVGKAKYPWMNFVAADVTHLPYASDSFDAVTMSFGLRNVVDYEAGLRELLRVTKPGGRMVICEFSSPTWEPFRVAYTEYLMRALPAVATAVSSNPDAYVYLAESIRAWPHQAELANSIGRQGWTCVEYRNLTGGIVALHRATKPARGAAS